jgi:hypothetical protein
MVVYVAPIYSNAPPITSGKTFGRNRGDESTTLPAADCFNTLGLTFGVIRRIGRLGFAILQYFEMREMSYGFHL